MAYLVGITNKHQFKLLTGQEIKEKAIEGYNFPYYWAGNILVGNRNSID